MLIEIRNRVSKQCFMIQTVLPSCRHMKPQELAVNFFSLILTHNLTHKGWMKDFPPKHYHVCNMNASAVLSTRSVNTYHAVRA
jgi:hypothetical protein